MDCNLDELHYMFDSTFFAESRYRFIPEYYINGNSNVKLQLIMSTNKARKIGGREGGREGGGRQGGREVQNLDIQNVGKPFI